MAVSPNAPQAVEPATKVEQKDGTENTKPPAEAPKSANDDDTVNPTDFDGAVRTNNKLPSQDTLLRIADLPVLDREGKSQPFKSLYAESGRTLIIFIRHFYCGNCQEYLRTLSLAIPPSALSAAAPATRIVVVGCGEPALIDMYAEVTGCAYPIYADPTRRLYDELGMVQTLALGARKPDYMKGASMWSSAFRSIAQGLRQLPKGLALKGGNQRQVGGEFLFVGQGEVGDIQVTWCHRMKTTRDHAEAEELKEVLGLPKGTEKGEADGHTEAAATA